MKFRITHRTAYGYGRPVFESFNEVRLRPVSSDTQTCLYFDLSIDPPTTVSTFVDYYGNQVHNFGVPYLHDRLTIEATSDVVTFAGAAEPLTGQRPGQPDVSAKLEAVVSDPRVMEGQAEFLNPSAYVLLEPASREIAKLLKSEDPATTVHAFLLRAGRYIREHFKYELGATTVHSTVRELIEGGSGVCQDYAHLLISICRHVGLPARYVSGYLGDVAESTASHAWVEAWAPPYGWVGIDPTVGAPCTGRHVKVAVGRDYKDVAVVKGTYRGAAEATLEVVVRSATLDGEAPADARGGLRHRSRGKLVQYQTLGSMQQKQRLSNGGWSFATQSMGSMSQTLIDKLEGMPSQQDDSEVPHQQPQQQQQVTSTE